jgi:hypothetical protein
MPASFYPPPRGHLEQDDGLVPRVYQGEEGGIFMPCGPWLDYGKCVKKQSWKANELRRSSVKREGGQRKGAEQLYGIVSRSSAVPTQEKHKVLLPNK